MFGPPMIGISISEIEKHIHWMIGLAGHVGDFRMSCGNDQPLKFVLLFTTPMRKPNNHPIPTFGLFFGIPVDWDDVYSDHGLWHSVVDTSTVVNIGECLD